MGLGLQDFAGTWRLDREVLDPDGSRIGDLAGEARFVTEGTLLVYREAGELTLNGATLGAEQTHLWRRAGTRIEVSFADGRPFHSFEPGLTRPTARHDCPPDVYHVTYDFGAWPDWSCHWDVRGPRKNYRLFSRYRRA